MHARKIETMRVVAWTRTPHATCMQLSSRVWRIGFRDLPRRFLPNVFIWPNVGLLPFRAELIHPLNQFWPALALLAAICGTALQHDSEPGQMLIWRATSIFNRLINKTLAVTSEREMAKGSMFTVRRLGYRSHRITEGIYICSGSGRALAFTSHFFLTPKRHTEPQRGRLSRSGAVPHAPLLRSNQLDVRCDPGQESVMKTCRARLCCRGQCLKSSALLGGLILFPLWENPACGHRFCT